MEEEASVDIEQDARAGCARVSAVLYFGFEYDVICVDVGGAHRMRAAIGCVICEGIISGFSEIFRGGVG